MKRKSKPSLYALQLDDVVFDMMPCHHGMLPLPPDAPSVMLKVILYAYSRGIIRSRDIATAWQENVTFMILCGDGIPQFTAIAALVRELKDEPEGFRRARNFGFLHPNCKRLIALLHLLLSLGIPSLRDIKFAPAQAMAWFKQRAPILCTGCGAVMVIVKTRIRSVFFGLMPAPILTQAVH
jgi:hypothetical protein